MALHRSGTDALVGSRLAEKATVLHGTPEVCSGAKLEQTDLRDLHNEAGSAPHWRWLGIEDIWRPNPSLRPNDETARD